MFPVTFHNIIKAILKTIEPMKAINTLMIVPFQSNWELINGSFDEMTGQKQYSQYYILPSLWGVTNERVGQEDCVYN